MISIVVISKDEPALDGTLAALAAQATTVDEPVEVIVVDASRGRLDDIRSRHPEVHWHDFTVPDGVGVSIPHQRNCGIELARGDMIVFTDAGCVPRDRWLGHLRDALHDGEQVVSGLAVAPSDAADPYRVAAERFRQAVYLDEAPTINLAFRRAAAEAVGGFDERFEYGSDLDFSWRLVAHGLRIRAVPDAVVEHPWGSGRRQMRRAYRYGRARVRLYRKHPKRRRTAWREDPIVWIYPLFILGLPLTLMFPAYPLLLAVPAWRARGHQAGLVVADHLAYGLGVLSGLLAPDAASASP